MPDTIVNIVRNLEYTLEAFRSAEIEDTRIFPIYAEYLVALRLEQLGFEAEVVNKKSYDILLNKKTRVEVKTGKYEEGGAAASFRKGDQIKDGKFEYCVFVTYDRLRTKEILVFRREELEEVALKPRLNVARYPNNCCLLLKFASLHDYLDWLGGREELDIEVKLHKHPEEFLDRWDKIKE